MGFRRLIVAGLAATFVAGWMALAGGASSGLSATRVGSDTRVFDRTLVCKTRMGFVSVTGGPMGKGPNHPGGLAVASSNGGLLPFAAVLAVNRGPGVEQRGAYVDTQGQCGPTSKQVPLTGVGLPPPVAFGRNAICQTGAQALVRLRYSYIPGVHDPRAAAGGRLVSASLAVRSYKTLKPVAFVKLTAGGTKLQFFNAASCRT